MSKSSTRKAFRKFIQRNREINAELNEMCATTVVEVERKVQEDDVARRREHVRRFAEVFETAQTIDKLDKLPAKLGLVSLALGFFAFFSAVLVFRVIFVVILMLLAAALILARIIRRDYRYQLAQQLAEALSFSKEFKTASDVDLVVYNFARTKL